MSNGRQTAPESFDRRDGPVSTFLLLALYSMACSSERPLKSNFGGMTDAKQGDATCEIPQLPNDVTFLTGPDPITEAELVKWPVEEVLRPCLFANGADVAQCASEGWVACEACVDARCVLCAKEDGSSNSFLYFPFCGATPCTFDHMSSLLTASADTCAIRLTWDALPEEARLWLNPAILEGEVCANLTRTRFRIGRCGAEVLVREIGMNYKGGRSTQTYVCALPASADVWSAAFPFRSCTAASWGLDSEIAAANWGYNPERPEVFRHEGALCVRVAGFAHQTNLGYWRPETPEELAGLKTDGCDPK